MGSDIIIVGIAVGIAFGSGFLVGMVTEIVFEMLSRRCRNGVVQEQKDGRYGQATQQYNKVDGVPCDALCAAVEKAREEGK